MNVEKIMYYTDTLILSILKLSNEVTLDKSIILEDCIKLTP